MRNEKRQTPISIKLYIWSFGGSKVCVVRNVVRRGLSGCVIRKLSVKFVVWCFILLRLMRVQLILIGIGCEVLVLILWCDLVFLFVCTGKFI